MYGLRVSAEKPFVGDPEEDIEAPNLRIFLTEIDQNENTVQEPRGTRGVIYYKVSMHKEGFDMETRQSQRSGWNTHPRARPGWARAWGGFVHPGLRFLFSFVS